MTSHRCIALVEIPRSPILQLQSSVNVAKSKWEIRLPQLLNSTVGPDRQVSADGKKPFVKHRASCRRLET